MHAVIVLLQEPVCHKNLYETECAIKHNDSEMEV